VLDSGKTQSFFLFASASDAAAAGPQVITASITSGTETVQQVALTANVKAVATSGWKTALEVIFIVLVVLLVIVGLVIGFSRLRSDEPAQTEPYY
jgi:hypothetical protein